MRMLLRGLADNCQISDICKIVQLSDWTTVSADNCQIGQLSVRTTVSGPWTTVRGNCQCSEKTVRSYSCLSARKAHTVSNDSCLHWRLSPLTVVSTDSCPHWQLSDLTANIRQLSANQFNAALTLLLVNLNVTNFTQGSNFDTLADQQGQCKSWDWVQQYCRAWRMCI